VGAAVIDWSTFFAAQLGASAGLAGLLFVGISINMKQIVEYPHLANKALQALMVLVTILLISSLLLVPDQSPSELGLEVLILGGFVAAIVAYISRKSLRAVKKDHRTATLFEAFMGELAMLFYVAAGIVLLTIGSEGIYLVVPGFLISFVNAIEDAWVLLVEVNR
jgi:hypothetical protein